VGCAEERGARATGGGRKNSGDWEFSEGGKLEKRENCATKGLKEKPMKQGAGTGNTRRGSGRFGLPSPRPPHLNFN